MRISNFLNRMSSRLRTTKKCYPSADRNKSFILDVLKKHIPTNTSHSGHVLEISSGTGQHVSYFAEHFPQLTFQPSEYETSLFDSIAAYANDTPTRNVLPPVQIDVTTDCDTWPLPADHLRRSHFYDYVINVNMMHISPFACTIGLFKNASLLLHEQTGLMFTYGPYAFDGVLEPQSNVDFDRNLRSENAEWGVRDVKELERVAAREGGLRLFKAYDLPSNNKCLVWINDGGHS